MIIYRDVLEKLKEAGYTTYDILKYRYLSQSTLTAIRQNKPISTKSIDVLCRLLQCQPGDILMYENDATDRK